LTVAVVVIVAKSYCPLWARLVRALIAYNQTSEEEDVDEEGSDYRPDQHDPLSSRVLMNMPILRITSVRFSSVNKMWIIRVSVTRIDVGSSIFAASSILPVSH
jgi:hypothetical protein